MMAEDGSRMGGVVEEEERDLEAGEREREEEEGIRCEKERERESWREGRERAGRVDGSLQVKTETEPCPYIYRTSPNADDVDCAVSLGDYTLFLSLSNHTLGLLP